MAENMKASTFTDENGNVVEIADAEAREAVAELFSKFDSNGGSDYFAQEYTYIEGRFLNDEGVRNSVSDAAFATFKVEAGEKFRLTTVGGKSVPFACFYRSDIIGRDTLISTTGVLSRTTTVIDYDVTIPENAVLMGVNNRYYLDTQTYPFEVKKLLPSEHSFEKIIGMMTANQNENRDADDRLKYESEQLERRMLKAEKNIEWCWDTFDKPYFIFVHDDTNNFLADAYSAFHSKGVPLGAATVVSRLNNTIGGTGVKDILSGIVADGGEVLCHYDYDLLDETEDSIWYEQVVKPKRILENSGYIVRGLILANASTPKCDKGEKFCRKYYDYADKVGKSAQYKLGRTLMLYYDTLDAFKAHIDECATKNGVYAFGFHGLREDEAWITQASLEEIIDYINAKGNCEITTYSALFDKLGTTVLEKRLSALENA